MMLVLINTNFQRVNQKSKTPLMEAVSLGKEAVVKVLIEEAWADPHVRDTVGVHQVLLCTNDSYDSRKCLPQSGNTLLHLSVGNSSLLKYLLEVGNANPALRNNVSIVTTTEEALPLVMFI